MPKANVISVTILDADGDDYTVELPAVWEVCGECDGSGFVLCDGMRGHAYSAEEFAESFDDDEQAEYFRPGGAYDQPCPGCKGRTTVLTVDRDACERQPALKADLAAYDAHVASEASYARQCAYERKMGY